MYYRPPVEPSKTGHISWAKNVNLGQFFQVEIRSAVYVNSTHYFTYDRWKGSI